MKKGNKSCLKGFGRRFYKRNIELLRRFELRDSEGLE